MLHQEQKHISLIKKWSASSPSNLQKSDCSSHKYYRLSIFSSVSSIHPRKTDLRHCLHHHCHHPNSVSDAKKMDCFLSALLLEAKSKCSLHRNSATKRNEPKPMNQITAQVTLPATHLIERFQQVLRFFLGGCSHELSEKRKVIAVDSCWRPHWFCGTVWMALSVQRHLLPCSLPTEASPLQDLHELVSLFSSYSGHLDPPSNQY